MQTFLPYSDFEESAVCLDRQRLGKQRVEAMQLLRVITNPDGAGGWVNHPATRMWRDHAEALALYGWTVCQVWIERGYRDTCQGKLLELVGGTLDWAPELPPWLGLPEFHASHRAALVAKLPEHYGPLFPDVTDPVIDYVWPSLYTNETRGEV